MAAAALLLHVALYLAVVPALAEQSGGGGVVVSFDGSISPRKVPRHRPAPVSMALSGEIRASDGAPPPYLTRIEIAIGARGGLETSGLPVCPRSRLRNATRRQALARCPGAIVGRGQISTEVPLDPKNPLLARADIVAFNGRSGGRPAVWVHAFSVSPPVSFVLPFHMRFPHRGAYGIVLEAPVARALGRWPRVRSFRLTIGRRYRAAGESRSYLNAKCPLPPRFHSLTIPLARATYDFAPRPTLTTPILRRCEVLE